MANKYSNKKQNATSTASPQQRRAQIFFAAFAVILILSMLFSAVAKF